MCEFGVKFTALYEFLVRASFHDFASAQHQNLIRFANRAQPMRDDEARSPAHQVFERFLDQPFGRRIYAGGSFVEDEYSGIFQQCPRDADSLFLTNA